VRQRVATLARRRCGFTPPPYLTEEVRDDPRREHDRMEMASYLDAANRPYVHLLDGGLVDNLGLHEEDQLG
jgi:NTE family protein